MTLNPAQMANYREARREGMPIATALYAVRPPVIDLDWMSHYQYDGEWAYFTHEGNLFRAESNTPEWCESCAELVEAWRKRDEGIAWMTSDEFDATDHRYLTVTLMDGDDPDNPMDWTETRHEAGLYGVCGTRNTPTQRRLDDRYIAETVIDLAHEAVAQRDAYEDRKRQDERDILWGRGI